MKNFEDRYYKQKYCMSSKYKYIYTISSSDSNVFFFVVVLKINCLYIRGKNPNT